MKRKAAFALGATAIAATLFPATAAAHGSARPVALDYRVALDRAPQKLTARIAGGGRSLEVRVAPGVVAVVRGYLREPMLAFRRNGVWLNTASPTARSDRLFTGRARGWQKVASGRSYTWHDHRLAPAANAPPVEHGRWSIPIELDARTAQIGGTFAHAARPPTWLWVALGALVGVAAVAVARLGRRELVVPALGFGAGIAALALVAGFAVETDRGAWISVGTPAAIALVAAAVVAYRRPKWRVDAAAVVGATAAFSVLTALPIFSHGVVVSALPAVVARGVCVIAIVAGVAAVVGAFMRPRSRAAAVAVFALVGLVAAGCGGSSSSTPQLPTIQAARTFELTKFKPAAPVAAGKPTTVSFVIRRPDGKPLTAFKRGAGPHTGVHLIFVRRDLAYIVHRHPPIAADGTIRDRVTLPAPGPYRLVVDAYPRDAGPQRSFQLFRNVRGAGDYRPQPTPAFKPSTVVDGYRFTLHGRPQLRAIQAALLDVTVTDPNGRPARFTPWYGALAHAIFFRKGTLDYFHTHVCSPGAVGCTTSFGAASVTGSSTKPGRLQVGVLVPVAGTWRLFLQGRVNGKILTAPFTLVVK
jgi:hypothetical protein